jgi:hypothetical protein
MYRVLLAALVLSGCASLTESQCRADDDQWEWLGQYDAVQGDQPWIEAYAKVCSRYGLAVREDAYLKGWDVGHAAFKQRVEFD